MASAGISILLDLEESSFRETKGRPGDSGLDTPVVPEYSSALISLTFFRLPNYRSGVKKWPSIIAESDSDLLDNFQPYLEIT